MPNTVVNLGDLQVIVEKYSNALNRHDGRRLNADGSVGDPVDARLLQEVADACANVNRLCSQICQQPVLAIRLTEQTQQ